MEAAGRRPAATEGRSVEVILSGRSKRPDCVPLVPQTERGRVQGRKRTQRNDGWKLPSLVKDVDPHTQEPQTGRPPERNKAERSSRSGSLQSNSQKQDRSSREARCSAYEERTIQGCVDSATGTVEGRGKWSHVLKVLKGENAPPATLSTQSADLRSADRQAVPGPFALLKGVLLVEGMDGRETEMTHICINTTDCSLLQFKNTFEA